MASVSVGKHPLPNGWRWVSLGEVGEIIAGQSPPSETYRKTPEGMPFFQGKADFGKRHPIARVWCVAPTKIALPGDMLVSIRAPVGPTNVANLKCCIGRGLAAFRPNSQTDRDFILAALRLYEADLAKLGSGSTFSAVSRGDLEEFRIPLPPLSEQKRIAAILSEEMAAVERARAAAEARLEAAKALPAAYLRQVFESEEAKAWPRKRLGEIGQVVNGFGFAEHLQGRTDLPYPFVKVSDMNAAGAGTVVKKAANTVDSGILATLGARTCPAGTVIFPKVGGALLTNKKRILDVEACFDNNIMGVVPHGVESQWLYYWLQTVDLRKLSNTQALPSIRQSEVAALQIPLPPLAEQKRIAAILAEKMAAVERVKNALKGQLDAINKLPAALLRRAFSGEL